MADRADGIMRSLPVDVAPGTAALTVELRYPSQLGVLDLGCEGPNGFRGWSGGARTRFTLSAGWATPGYLAGELEPGQWNVLLRLHRIPPDGLEYEVVASTTDQQPAAPDQAAAPPVPQRPPRRDIPAVDGMRWLAGDLHSHSVHSDGMSTVAELAALAAGRGLDFLAVTDHNTVSHHAELPATGRAYAIALLPGQEVTTDRGHANAFGSIGWVDFRRPAADWVAAVERDGGLLSINHPLGGDCAWRHPLPVHPPLAEIWHSGWFDRTWGAPLAWAQAWGPDVIPVGGSDYHRPGNDGLPGEPTTWVLTDPAAEPERGLLDGLRSGQVAVSAGPGEPVLLRIGDELLALDADGTVLTAPDGSQRVVRGDRARFRAPHRGLHLLETYRTEVVALCL
jgi:hypothetical protein